MNDRTTVLGPKGLPFGGTPYGPRQPGTKNKDTLARLEMVRVAQANPGPLPIDFCLEVMRDEENDKELRLKAAIAAGRWLHPSLQAIKIEEKAQVQVQLSPDELRGMLVKLLLDSGAIRGDLLKPMPSQGILTGPVENDEN